MSEILVNTPSKSYPIFLKSNQNPLVDIQQTFSLLQNKYPHSKIALITDDTLLALFRHSLEKFAQHENSYVFPIPNGETSKSIETKLRIEKFLFQKNFDRNSILLAFGGGVVGDLVGYVASTFMRGVPFFAFPSSLIAMADSSIGGKTAINTPFGKNLIGTFYHPQAVYICLALLNSLPDVEYWNGMAEVVKYGFIKDPALLDFIQINLPQIQSRNLITLHHLVLQSIKIKRNVVQADECENAYRRILNFGHTIGHAVELLSNFQLKHGQAVAVGMAVEAFFSTQLGQLPIASLQKIRSLLQKLQLPITIPTYCTPEKLYHVMLHDKKNKHGTIRLNFLKKLGAVEPFNNQFVKQISQPDFFKLINNYIHKFPRP